MPSASLAAVSQVLGWAAEQGMSIRGLSSTEQLEALARVFSGQQPWSFELYEPLRAFSHAVPRLNLPDVPTAMHFGDALAALDELLSERGHAWSSHPSIAAASFEELGYARASAGISRLREEHAAAWSEHALANKELLLRGVERTSGRVALVVGAGKLYDIPLRRLVERFELVWLVDIDGEALAQSVAQLSLPASSRARLRLVTTDVTGINDVFLQRARSALHLADPDSAYQGLLALLHAYCLAAPPRLVPTAQLAEAPPDFACSSMVLSQLATPLSDYLERGFAERFPESSLTTAHEFQLALAQLTHRVQHAHIAALLAAAPCVAISSDITEQYTQLDAHGRVLTAAPLPLIGAPHLEDLVPVQTAHVVSSSEWTWDRVVPTPPRPHGRHMQVVGIIAERRSPLAR
jgi:hypothetical protein